MNSNYFAKIIKTNGNKEKLENSSTIDNIFENEAKQLSSNKLKINHKNSVSINNDLNKLKKQNSIYEQFPKTKTLSDNSNQIDNLIKQIKKSKTKAILNTNRKLNLDFDSKILNTTNDSIFYDSKLSNFDENNNSYFNSNNISKNLSKKDSIHYISPNGNQQNNKKLSTNLLSSINLEDLMILEEKLFEILEMFKKSNPSIEIINEWWCLFKYASIDKKVINIFNEESHKKIIKMSINLEFICILISLECSIDKTNKLFLNTINLLKNILNLIHQNFLILCEYIISLLCEDDSFSNVWINKVRHLILSKINKRLKKGDHINLMKQNNEIIINNLKIIKRIYIINHMNKNSEFMTIINFIKDVSNNSNIFLKSLNDQLKKRMIYFYSKTGNFLPEEIFIEEGEILTSIPVPYLKNNCDKKYTLVLDLDETLIHFKINNETNKGTLKLRPGLYEFLGKLKEFFEIVIFTASTQDYADPILDSLEKEIKYFDNRLYRQHAIIIENDFVKDLSKLGRDLSKCLIIDNIPQNYKLQKENGIYIKTFNGEDEEDTALLDLLQILLKLLQENNNDIDLRKEIKKYNNDIFRKVTTNLFKINNTNE